MTVNSMHGAETSELQISRLESVRQAQEAAWYQAGRSRDWIIKEFGAWPTQLGYRPYEWTVGLAPERDHA